MCDIYSMHEHFHKLPLHYYCYQVDCKLVLLGPFLFILHSSMYSQNSGPA